MVVGGLMVKVSGGGEVVGFLLFFPLTFASSAFVPTQTMPAWFQGFTEHQPVTVVTNALRGLILGQAALPGTQTVAGLIAPALFWSATILAAFAPLAVHIYLRS